MFLHDSRVDVHHWWTSARAADFDTHGSVGTIPRGLQIFIEKLLTNP